MSVRRRRRWIGAGLALALILGFDLSRAPERQLSARALLAGIDFYQAVLSPLGEKAGARCRFVPTCSRYAEQVIRRHGALVGSAKAAWRILRCGPWTAMGTADPPTGPVETDPASTDPP